MTEYVLGINTCFAVKRWPRPEEWARMVREELDLDLVQHSLDLVSLDGSASLRRRQAEEVAGACRRFGLEVHSTFSGLAAYSSNLLLDPDPHVRAEAERWYRRAVAFTAEAGARATGGHVGAFSVLDWQDIERRRELEDWLKRALHRLAGVAWRAGLEALYVENFAAAREPSTMEGIQRLLTPGDDRHVPVALCLDVGHQCVPGTSGPERDPYAWLERMGSRAPVVHLQQSDAKADHHWPFTAEANRAGRIDPDRVLVALDRSWATKVLLILEIIPPFEQDDDRALGDLVESVVCWRDALRRHGDSRSIAQPPSGPRA
jgi:sugar phosphate isomerase/epimerase